MTDELRIQALQAALDQANMMLIEQREVMGVALDALTCTGEADDPGHRCGCCDDYVDRNGPVRKALREMLGSEE